MVLPPRNGLSLAAGGGGLDMGLELAEPGFAAACYVEWDEYPQQALRAAQRAGYFHAAPIWDDVRTFDARPWRGRIDTLLAGYPCQPFSQAGQRRGEDDERHLWPDIERIIEELGPGLRWCFFENVAGHLTLGLDTVLHALRRLGFTTAVGLFTANEIGASHERKRVFIVAHRDGTGRCGIKKPDGEPEQPGQQAFGRGDADGCDHDVADSYGWHTGPERQQRGGQQRFQPEGRGTRIPDVDDAGPNADPRGVDGGTDRGCAPEGEGDIQERERLRNRAGRTSDDVGHAAGDGRREGRAEHEFRIGRDASAVAGGELADTRSAAGYKGGASKRGRGNRKGIARETIITVGHRPYLFPPGTDDMDAWRDVLGSHPELAPALSLGDIEAFASYFAALVEAGELSFAAAESKLRRMADGLARRPRALRLLGNGVVSLEAAYAWRTLSAALGLGWVDMGSADADRTTRTDGV